MRLCALVLIGVSSGAALAKDTSPTAIVVGGGLAGLTAAYELQNKGWQVTLLEAKSGMGGRSGLATSEWIGNGKSQPVLNQYLDRFKLETLPAPEFVRTPGYLIDGEYFSASPRRVASAFQETLLDTDVSPSEYSASGTRNRVLFLSIGNS